MMARPEHPMQHKDFIMELHRLKQYAYDQKLYATFRALDNAEHRFGEDLDPKYERKETDDRR